MRFVTFLMLVSFVFVFAVYQVNAQKFSIEGEDFDAKKGESWQIMKVPAKVMSNPDSTPRAPELIASDGKGIAEFTIVAAASRGAFLGHPNNPSTAVSGDWVKYTFDIPKAGDWYIWARVIAPTIGDNSFFVGIDVPDAKAVAEDNNDMNIWDFHESAEIPDDGLGTALNTRFTTKWVWFRLCSRTGNPFPGTEIVQYGPKPTPYKFATTGGHTIHLVWRERSYCDVIFLTMDASDNPNKNQSVVPDIIAVETRNKLTTTWGQLKQRF